jgi:hypothetical protein
MPLARDAAWLASNSTQDRQDTKIFHVEYSLPSTSADGLTNDVKAMRHVGSSHRLKQTFHFPYTVILKGAKREEFCPLFTVLHTHTQSCPYKMLLTKL